MTEEILFEKQGYLGVATLNRPNALNALTLPMIQSLQDQLTEWESDRNIHAVLIQATPGKSFCAGGDVRWLYESGLRKDAQQMEFFSHEYRLNHYIHRYSKPYIALMNGITMGAGWVFHFMVRILWPLKILCLPCRKPELVFSRISVLAIFWQGCLIISAFIWV